MPTIREAQTGLGAAEESTAASGCMRAVNQAISTRVDTRSENVGVCCFTQGVDTTTTYGVGLALVLLLVLVLLVHRRQRRKWKAQRADDARLHQQHLAGVAAEHHQHVLALQAGQAASDALRDRAMHLAARGMRWELNSRETLVKACEAASLNAIVATNVVFAVISEERSFCAQIDHVVVTDNTVLVIDSKYWNGLVFDGTRPSQLAAPLAALLDEKKLTPPFAVHLRQRDDASIGLRIDAGPASPARQVRLGASRLHAYLAPRVAELPYIDTCVFYSHPDATVVTPGFDVQGRARTSIADVHTIGSLLRRAHAARSEQSSPERVDRIAEALTELGADIVRTGAFAVDRPVSPVALEYRVQTRRERSLARAGSTPTEPRTGAAGR